MRLKKARRDRRPAAALAMQNDRSRCVELVEAVRKRRQRNVNRARQMALSPFLGTPNIDYLDAVDARDSAQLSRIYVGKLLQIPSPRCPLLKNVLPEDSANTGQADFAQVAQCCFHGFVAPDIRDQIEVGVLGDEGTAPVEKRLAERNAECPRYMSRRELRGRPSVDHSRAILESTFQFPNTQEFWFRTF